MSGCPLCRIKAQKTSSAVSNVYRKEPFNNGLAMTPPMGWNSWNYFKENINEKMLIEMAKAIKDSGLLNAGYNYFNLDDYWEDYYRSEFEELQADSIKFPNGMAHFVQEINKLGFKAGIYSSNGYRTCQGLPASLYREYMDALAFSRWGIEYLKYDFCYHEFYSKLAPQIFGASVEEPGSVNYKYFDCKEAKLSGKARIKHGKSNIYPTPKAKKDYIVGLDNNRGMAVFTYNAEVDGEHIFTLDVRFREENLKSALYFAVKVNDGDIKFSEICRTNRNYRFGPVRISVNLKKGKNEIAVFNPISTHADSVMINYMTMSDALIKAAKTVTKETGVEHKPIVFSVCEWGSHKPWEWGATVANLWRTTGDIEWTWKSIMKLYEQNVVLYKYASPGHWNDPDMLEVGNGKLTIPENKAHFSLWCMMASPLLLGNDVVNMKKEHFEILVNKNLIAIDQDTLGKQAKRIFKSRDLDVLVRPLADGGIALCALNKSDKAFDFEYDLSKLVREEYVEGYTKAKYTATNLWEDVKEKAVTSLKATIEPHGVVVYKLN